MRSLLLVTFTIVFGFAQSQNYTEKVLNPPITFSCEEATPKHNRILYGSTPPDGEEKPILVFIHGFMDNGYGWFMLNNSMYKNAYNEGYRTAFLFHPQNKGVHDNARIIAEMLEKVVAHYNNEALVLIPHSKGGLDAELAMYEYKMDPLVKAVISLSTPYFGVPVAEFYSNPLIKIIGDNIPYFGSIIRQPGTRHLQPGYVNGVIRPFIDSHPENKPWKFFNLGGWGANHRPNIPDNVPFDLTSIVFYWPPISIPLPVGSFFESAIQLAFSIGGVLTNASPATPNGNNPFKEQNDGLVPFHGSTRPGGMRILPPYPSPLSELNHFEFLYGQAVWPFISNTLNNIDSLLEVNELNYISSSNTTSKKSNIINKSSNLQIITEDNNLFKVKSKNATLYILESTGSGIVKIVDIETKEEVINYEPEGESLLPVSIINKLSLSSIAVSNKSYSITSEGKFIAFLTDNDPISLNFQLETKPSLGATTSDEFKNNKLTLSGISKNQIKAYKLSGMVQRNLLLNGKETEDDIIFLDYILNENFEFVPKSTNPVVYESGIYNLTFIAEHETSKRFLTTSIAIKDDEIALFHKNDDLKIKTYPNPFRNHLSVNFDYEGLTELSIHSIDGNHTVYHGTHEKVLKESIVLDNHVSAMSAGMYLIRIKIEDVVISLPILKF